MAARRKLPNLKICVDNTQSTDESDVEIEDSDSSRSEDDNAIEIGNVRTRGGLEDGEVHEDEDNDVLSIGTSGPTERRFLSRSSLRQTQPIYGPRIYENKSGDFVTGLDVTSEPRIYENKSGDFVTGLDVTSEETREKREKRFGTLSTPKQPITDVDIKNIYRSLGMSTESLEQDIRGWRTDAIMLRGTESMSTRDVFDYFREYGPKGVEWIDDYSCNVLWQDKLSPARALLRLSKSMEDVLPPAGKTIDRQKENFQGVSPLNRDGNKDQQENVTKLDKNVTAVTDSGTVAATAGPEHESTRVKPAQNSKLQTEVVLNVLEEETMELDYDDNLDLTGEDPIDQALATWANFSQNKKLRAEKANQSAARKSSTTQDEGEKLPGKEKVIVKEEKDTDEKVTSGSKATERGKSSDTKSKNRHPDQDMELEVGGRSSSSKTSREKTRLSKDNKRTRLKDAPQADRASRSKRAEKMDTGNGSDSDSDSSGSSSSESGSSSSGSGSSSDSESESGSGYSSSSSAKSVEGVKKQQRKSHDKEKPRKSIRKTAVPPILPAAREKADIPWPPGWWRLGVPHPKAEYIFMRYAMKADKKLPGAEKRSEYYKKYGNPNFGGIVGLISNSRKRKLRNSEYAENQDSTQESLASSQSKLAGRIGTRRAVGGGKRRGSKSEDESGFPVLKEGTDLRDLLNKEVSAVRTDTGETEVSKDTDDEMDYGAELERLMGDNAPPAKKRFMRMHADDEEEKILAKRLLQIKKVTKRWPSRDLSNEDDYDDNVEGEKEEERFKSRRKEWVDYDNVEDDDPFNLFGTSKQTQSLTRTAFDGGDENVENRRSVRGQEEDEWRSRDVKQRLGSTDLRAKIQSLKRVSNRNW